MLAWQASSCTLHWLLDSDIKMQIPASCFGPALLTWSWMQFSERPLYAGVQQGGFSSQTSVGGGSFSSSTTAGSNSVSVQSSKSAGSGSASVSVQGSKSSDSGSLATTVTGGTSTDRTSVSVDKSRYAPFSCGPLCHQRVIGESAAARPLFLRQSTS